MLYPFPFCDFMIAGIIHVRDAHWEAEGQRADEAVVPTDGGGLLCNPGPAHLWRDQGLRQLPRLRLHVIRFGRHLHAAAGVRRKLLDGDPHLHLNLLLQLLEVVPLFRERRQISLLAAPLHQHRDGEPASVHEGLPLQRREVRTLHRSFLRKSLLGHAHPPKLLLGFLGMGGGASHESCVKVADAVIVLRLERLVGRVALRRQLRPPAAKRIAEPKLPHLQPLAEDFLLHRRSRLLRCRLLLATHVEHVEARRLQFRGGANVDGLHVFALGTQLLRAAFVEQLALPDLGGVLPSYLLLREHVEQPRMIGSVHGPQNPLAAPVA